MRKTSNNYTKKVEYNKGDLPLFHYNYLYQIINNVSFNVSPSCLESVPFFR